MGYGIPNFSHITNEDGKVYGGHNTVTSVNPYKTFFMVNYPDGTIIKGNNLFITGWEDIPNGFSGLAYVLSTGHTIQIPKFKAYKPLIEVSIGMDGSRVFHSIRVKCLDEHSIIVDKIILTQDLLHKYKIGDRVLSREPLPEKLDKSWKFTN